MAIVTISREFGSGGNEVASRICDLLGYHSFGKEQIVEAASQTNIGKYNVIDYSEDNHEVQTFLDWLFGRTASPVQKIAWAEDPSIASHPNQIDVHDAAVLSLTKRAILSAARKGNMVIIGRGGQVLLRDTPDTVHVRIEAPKEMRIERIMKQLQSESGSDQSEDRLHQTAANIIATRDIASADYIKRFFSVDWQDQRLYHMVLNLGKLSIEQAAQIIAAAVNSLEVEPVTLIPSG